MTNTLVVYITYNMGNRDLPTPSGQGIYIRQIPLAHVITYTYVYRITTAIEPFIVYQTTSFIDLHETITASTRYILQNL